MPRFIDIHEYVPGLSRAASSGEARVAVQNPHDAKLLNYWINDKTGMVLCLLEAPDRATAIRFHLEEHGLIPDEISEVPEGS